MSIEDIDFLYKNSIKESSIILIDSSKKIKIYIILQIVILLILMNL